jgi:hypothetical protein
VVNSYNTISILKNEGDGTFAAAVTYGVDVNPSSVCAADLDGDGDSDLAVANRSSNNLSILKNNGDGTFAAAVNYGVGSSPMSVCAADLDGDGDVDLAVANRGSNSVSILINTSEHALSFDGSQLVTIPNRPSLNPSHITVECWVKFNRFAYGGGYYGTDAQFPLCKGGDRTPGGYRLMQGGSSPSSVWVCFAIGPFWDGHGVCGAISPSLLGSWCHLAGTYDGDSLKCYLNGSLLGSSYAGSISVSSSSPLYFSYDDVQNFPYELTGSIDEVRIWNYARTEQEIRNSMNVRLAGSEGGLVGYWRLDEGQGQVVSDAATNANNGYLGSSPDADSQDPTWITFDYPSLPSPPSDLAAQTISASEIDLMWHGTPSGETYFELWRKTGTVGAWSIVASLPGNTMSWSSTGLTAGTTYYYRVRACNRAGCSVWSNTVTATTGGIPAAPGNLVATAISAAQIDLAWRRNSTNELGFKIERKLGEAGQWSEIARPGAGSTAYQDRAFNACGTYYYRVRAYNSAANSNYSAEANATNQAPSSFASIIEVRLGTALAAGATVRVDRGDGAGFVEVGTTDSYGHCSVTNLSVGNRIQARKKLREQPSVKPDHGDVGNIAWELWADSDCIQDDGSYESVVVLQQRASNDPYVLTLVHPTFKFNLVVSVEWDMTGTKGTEYSNQLKTCFNKASDYLYDITDGQAMFNKVVIYDCGANNKGADVVIFDRTDRFGTSWPEQKVFGITCVAPGWESNRKIGLSRILHKPKSKDYYSPSAAMFSRGVVHEFGHWAFVFLDEYINGNGNYAKWYTPWNPFDERPGNFGLMDDEQQNPTEMSSQNDYPANWDGDPEHTTMQYSKTNKSCWDYFESLYSTFLDPGLKITKPLPGNFKNQAKPPRRDGPMVTTGAVYEPVFIDKSDGSFETRLSVAVGNSPAVGAYVFQQGRRGTRYLGQADGSGSLEASGVNDDVIFAYPNGHSRSQETGHATSSMRPGGPLQLMTGKVNRSAATDTKAPGAVVDAEPVQPLSNPSILVRIWPDEPLASAPLLTAHVGGGITPVAMTANGSCYSGSLVIDTADTLYSGEGFFDISLSDTAGNGSTFFLAFKLWDVGVGSEPLLDWGSASYFLGSDDITQSSLVLATFSNTSLVPPGSNLTSVGDQSTIHVSPEDAYPSGTAINISYEDTLLSGVDETSVAIMRWDPTGLSWVPVSGSTVAAPINVVSASVPTGGVYRAFATVSSSDATAPSAVNDLGAVGTQNSGELILDWTAPGDDGMIGTALDYIVALSESLITEENWLTTDKSVLPMQPAVAGSHEVATILLPHGGQHYYVALRAKDEAGNMSPLSNIAQGFTGIGDPNLVTGPPRNFRAVDRPSDNGNGVLLTWEPSFDDGGGKGTAKRYRILRTALPSVAFQAVDSVPAGTTSYVDSTVEAGMVYRYWVSAVDSARESYSEQNNALCARNVGVPMGDFTSDAVVGVNDFSYLVDSYAIDSTSAEFDPLYDLNKDGQIHAADFDSLEAYFGEGGAPQSDSGAANAGAKVCYRWVHITGNVWNLNVVCSSAYDLAGYSFRVRYDGGSMTLSSVTADSMGTHNNLLNAKGGLTPLFLVREGNSAVTIANVIKGASSYASASGGGFLASLAFNCSSPGPTSVDDIVLMDSEKRLSVVDHATAVSENPAMPRAYVLYPNYPNPFNPATTIRFDLPAASKVVLRVYDVAGREVATLANERMDAGQHAIVWNGQNKRGRAVASGVYFCRLEAGKFVATRKLVMLR